MTHSCYERLFGDYNSTDEATDAILASDDDIVSYVDGGFDACSRCVAAQADGAWDISVATTLVAGGILQGRIGLPPRSRR